MCGMTANTRTLTQNTCSPRETMDSRRTPEQQQDYLSQEVHANRLQATGRLLWLNRTGPQEPGDHLFESETERQMQENMRSV